MTLLLEHYYRVVQLDFTRVFNILFDRALSIFTTEACKIIPACLKIPALVLPGNLASICTANQPILESLSSILTTLYNIYQTAY